MKFVRFPKSLFMVLSALSLVGLVQAAMPEGRPLQPISGGARNEAPIPPPHFSGGWPSLGMPVPPEFDGIALSEAQQDKLFQIFHDQAPVLRVAMKKARQAEDQLQDLASNPGFSEARAKALAEAAGKAHAEILFLHASAQAQVQALLSPEQRRQVEEGGHRPQPPEF